MQKLQHIVNHDILDCSSNDSLEKVLGVYHYSGRVLGSTKPNDILQLNSELKPHWSWIVAHYKAARISHSRKIIWDDTFNIMTDFPTYEPSVFFFGDRANKARPNQEWHSIVQKMNSKNEFIQMCVRLNIPTPETWCYESKSEIDIEIDFPFPVYLKIAVSVSGLGVIKCENRVDLERELARIEENIPMQIQKGVNALTFLNLQYRMGDKLERIIATEQVLKGCCHVGNAYPTKYQPWHMTDDIAVEMVCAGMRGYFAFDIAVCKEGDKVRYYAIECNQRFNCSSYPTNIAAKLGIQKWVAKKMITACDNFSNIDLGELQYTPEKRTGVVVVNWGSIMEKEIGVMLIAESDIKQQKLEDQLMQILQ